MDAARALEIRKPLDELEELAVRWELDHPELVPDRHFDALRYVLSFARLTEIRTADGQDVDVVDFLGPHRWRVAEGMRPHLEAGEDGLGPGLRKLGELVRATQEQRTRLLENFEVDRESLEAEVTTRQLVLVAGGGGGGGFAYPGAFKSLAQRGLQPALLAGTSIGAIMAMFRARYRFFDQAPMIEANRRLSWSNMFRVLDMSSRYGLPASLRLHLRSELGSLFTMPDGRSCTFEDMEIPLLVATTGITLDALKHDLSYYEHFLDDLVTPGTVFRRAGLRRIRGITDILKEFMSEPNALREVIWGADAHTLQADVLDAVGFSSAIPGLIHYDVLRDDVRMTALLDQLYGEQGITRLTEGGLVNNVPARPAYAEVMSGRIERRNPYVVALDCFSPKPSSLLVYPLQQLVRPNVKANLPYVNVYVPLQRRLRALTLVPTVEESLKAMEWLAEELEPEMDRVVAMCRPLAVLHDEASP